MHCSPTEDGQFALLWAARVCSPSSTVCFVCVCVCVCVCVRACMRACAVMVAVAQAVLATEPHQDVLQSLARSHTQHMEWVFGSRGGGWNIDTQLCTRMFGGSGGVVCGF